MNLKGKNILVVGFGISGQAAARFLAGHGARVAVTDSGKAPETPLPPDLRGLEYHFGGHPSEIFEGRDLVVVSPGVPLNLPGLTRARSLKIPIIGEFGLAATLLKAPLIAVTGTNGKSTTVTLIDEMLRASGLRSALGGNIGTPLMEIVEEKKKFDWVVAEVSSYQLEALLPPFRPRISVVLNVTEDHLDRYPSIKEYAQAKFRIFRDQTSRDTLVYNGRDPIVARGVRGAKPRKVDFESETYPLDRMKLVGFHNQENMKAAITVAKVAGVSTKAIQKTIETFVGLPHRTEFVRTRLGVSYFDDSKGTNVDAAVKSLAGFPDRTVVLIAGGRDKGGSYETLKKAAAKKAKAVIVLGEARRRLAEALRSVADVSVVKDLEEAVPLAASKAKAGDVVLLSPACSSFDQFKDYKERGETFQRLVKEL